MEPVLVTGATGNVGREVVRVLERAGTPVRAASHRAGGASGVRLDFRDPTTWEPALSGCRAVFLLRPPAIADVKDTLNPFVDRARALGVSQVVFLSVAGAGDNSVIPHHAVERHLAERGGDWTVLRPGFFAQNLQDAYRRDIIEDGRLYVPAGKGRAAFIDLRDVAEVAALAFADPAGHRHAAHTLTGPEAVAFDEAARILTAVLGYPVRYEPASALGYLRHVRRRGVGWGQAVVQAILHVGLRFGQAEAVDPTLERLLGRPGHTLRDYVEAHADVWRRDAASIAS